MKIVKLDHVNARTTQLDTMIDWNTNVLGLRSGDRPNLPYPGAWMYAGDDVVVHLVGIKGRPGAGSELDLKLDHFAFTATGGGDLETRLRTMGEQYHRVDISPFGLVQFDLWDPDRNHIQIDFPTDE